MSAHLVQHACGHEERYRVRGARTLVEHHLDELERSPCTPCAEAAAESRRHIYLGLGARVVRFPSDRVRGTDAAPTPAAGQEEARRGVA
jgi:hypothetical protein